jgi:hypothetical protein
MDGTNPSVGRNKQSEARDAQYLPAATTRFISDSSAAKCEARAARASWWKRESSNVRPMD